MSAYTFRFDPVAADEYEEALGWYETKSSIATDGFIIGVQGQLKRDALIPTDQ